ncbi:hypothetical protein K5X82_03280 [Halosquirtibacter xylanolyticus]|uniref:alpha-L-rhamnosidase-related protein n=1 Tax=Halosquirtibacter xylanolyticus TaxID=3374599 RepID=UPI003747C812|nr:hypothetical protein K5X82_03280 [Prolixibacteraceae bacterium]
MNSLKWPLLLILLFYYMSSQANHIDKWAISYEESCPEALIGNGKEVYITGPLSFHRTGNSDIKGIIQIDQAIGWSNNKYKKEAHFYPSAVVYKLSRPHSNIDILYASTPDDPFVIYIRYASSDNPVTLTGTKEFIPQTDTVGNNLIKKYSSSERTLSLSWDQLLEEAIKPYTQDKIVLDSPNQRLNRAMAFNQYLLDLAYNGELIVCDMFRWRDIWSRDLGSGFGIGALRSNDIKATYDCIQYDIKRYEKSPPNYLKTTEDASQGGSAEGLSFLTQLIWQYYLVTGELDWLEDSYQILKPWVDQWVNRDYDQNGLIVDVTDWMDHSRHYLLPYGSQTLYSNALMVKLLEDFSQISGAIGHTTDAQHYLIYRQRFVDGINDNLWSDPLGAYVNLAINDQKDLRIASAANSLALIAKIPSSSQAKTIIKSLKRHNWRKSGSLTMSPKMTHIESDQNEHIWPWWNAIEAKAHSLNGDKQAGVRLLENCAQTLSFEKYPGLMEELMYKDGVSEGGNAFATAAGSFIDAVYSGLFGIEIIQTKQSRIRILPNIPTEWKNTSLKVPTTDGSYTISHYQGQTTVTVNDSQIKEVEVEANTKVVGAKKVVYATPATPVLPSSQTFETPQITKRKAFVLEVKGLIAPPQNVKEKVITLEQLTQISSPQTSALIIYGNKLPFTSKQGVETTEYLQQFISQGGAIVFWGCRMMSKDVEHPQHYKYKMGHTSGVISWYKKIGSEWKPYDSQLDEIIDQEIHGGTIYWGRGAYFNAWELQKGVFGFKADGMGICIGKKNYPTIKVNEVFTDFAVSRPWYFISMANTHITQNFMVNNDRLQLSCFARLVNCKNHGEIILIGESISDTFGQKKIAKMLKYKF